MGTRTARIGFAVYAITLGLVLGLGWWQLRAIQAPHAIGEGGDLLRRVLGAAAVALELLGALALFATTRLPASLRVRRLLGSAAGLALLGVVAGQLQQLAFDRVGYGHLSRWLPLLMSGTLIAIYTVSELLLLVAAMRLARAVSAEWLRALAIAGLVSRAAVPIVWLMPLAYDWMFWVHRASLLIVIVVSAGLAALVPRVPDEAPPAMGDDDGALAPAYREAAAGIDQYLGAIAARILLALIGWALMMSARAAHSLAELSDLRSWLLLLAALSAAATLVMLGGLWRIGRAPLESQAWAPAQLACLLGALGLLLDGWNTWITADVLGGSLSSARFAIKVLPAIVAATLALGVGTSLSLLRALGNLARALGRAELVGRARDASVMVVATAVCGALAMALSGLGSEVLLVLMLLTLPLALIAAVQLVRVAVGVARAIRVRLA